MALSTFNVQVDLGIGGIQTGVSAEKVVPGTLQQLKNADISVPGRIQKRRAFSTPVPNDLSSSSYDKVFSLFSSDRECYRIVDNVATASGTIYTGNWFLNPSGHVRRMRYGHRVLQKLTNPNNTATLPTWTTLGAVGTPIITDSLSTSFINANRPVGVGDAYNLNVFTSANIRQAASCYSTYSGRKYVGVAVSCQPDSTTTSYAVGFQVLDYDTKQPISRLSLAQGNYSSALITTVSSYDGRYIYFIYYDTTATTTYCRSFDCSTGAFVATVVTLHSGSIVSYSVESTETSLVFAYAPGAGAIVGIKKYTFAKCAGGSGAAPAVDFSTTTATAVNNATSISINSYTDYGDQEHCAIFWTDTDATDGFIKARMYDGSLTAVAATTTIQTEAKSAFTLVTVSAKPISIPYSTTAGATITNSRGQSLIYVDKISVGLNVTVSITLNFFAESAGTVYGYYSDNIKGAVSAAMPFGFSQYVRSNLKGYTGGIDDNYILCRRAPPSGIEDTSLYLMQTSLVVQTPKTNMDFYSRCVAKIDRVVASTLVTNGCTTLARVAVIGDAEESAILPAATQDIDCQFYNIKNAGSQLGDTVLDSYKEILNGGYAHQIGSSYVMEREPLFVPATPFLQNGGVGSLTALGTYQFCTVARIQYDSGLIMRSAPSLPSTIVLPGGVTAVSVGSQAQQALSCVAVNDNNYSIVFEVYRTTNGGTTFYLDTTVSAEFPIYFTFSNSTQSDTTLQTRPILYTNGGVLENITAPNISSITRYKGRLAASVGQSEPCIWVSKEQTNSSTGQFTDAFKVPISSKGYEVTVVRELDDKIIIFTEDTISFIYGEGPNDTGTTQSFGQPIKISENVGCVSNKAITRLDNQILFRGREGFYFLKSNLTVEKVSLPVQYFATLGNYEVTSTIQLDNRKQIQFYTSNGYRLVYFIETQQWTLDNIGASLAARYRDSVVVVKKTGATYTDLEMHMESASYLPSSWTYSDNIGGYYPLEIKTGWVPFTGLQGLARVWRCILLGRAYTNCTIKVGFSYDYNPTVIDISDWVVDTTTTLSYTDDDLYLNLQPSTSSTLPPLQKRIHMPRQKVEAVQITIWDTAQTGIGKSFELNQITFEVGLRQGIMKLSQAQSS